MSLRPAGLEAHLFPSRACSDATPVIARASVYYTRVLKKDRKKRRKISKHIKLSTVVDLDHQLPIGFKVRRGPASDHLDSVSLVRFAHQIKKILSLHADKGYTKEELRSLVVDKCLAEDHIAVKNPEVLPDTTKKLYETVQNIDQTLMEKALTPDYSTHPFQKQPHQP